MLALFSGLSSMKSESTSDGGFQVNKAPPLCTFSLSPHHLLSFSIIQQPHPQPSLSPPHIHLSCSFNPAKSEVTLNFSHKQHTNHLRKIMSLQ